MGREEVVAVLVEEVFGGTVIAVFARKLSALDFVAGVVVKDIVFDSGAVIVGNFSVVAVGFIEEDVGVEVGTTVRTLKVVKF